MLYLNPPFYFINGVTIFSDHEDPVQFYYLPAAPHLTQVVDMASGLHIPQIQLIEYSGEAGNGGFLNFDCNIGLEQAALDDLSDELKTQAKLRHPPRLAPVPIVDGTVKLILLDKQTGDAPSGGGTAPAGAAPAPGGSAAPVPTGGLVFVQKILQSTKPALYGDNNAMFSAQLTQNGVAVLRQALQGEMSPIGVVYALDYLALRPAYSVRLHMDWDRVFNHMEEHFGFDSIFFSADIDKAIDELIEKRAIVLEVDTFVPEGEDTKSIISSRDQAEAEVRDMITNTFFESSLTPDKETKDGWDKAEHLLRTTNAMAATGGWSAMGCFSYKKLDYTRIDKKVLNVSMSERTTVKRTIYPQGHLSGLFRPLLQKGIDLNNFIKTVDLDDPWFKRRKVMVISLAKFDDDLINSLNVTLRYGNEPKNVILEHGHDREEVQWGSNLVGAAMQWDVKARYKVNFNGKEGVDLPISLESPEKLETTEQLQIDPRDLYDIVHVPIVALDFPWGRYPLVEIQTRYTDEEHGIRLQEIFLLDDKKHEPIWKMFVRDRQHKRFAYKLIYRAANFKDVEMPWVETDEAKITIRDPYPQKRVLTIVPNLRWADVSSVFVDVSYDDRDNNVSAQQSFEFVENDNAPKTFTVDLVNPDMRMVAFEATIVKKDNTLIQIPKSYTLERRIFISDNMRGHKIVMIRPAATDFASKNIKQMTVDLLYEDKDAGLSFADTFSFKSSGTRASFEFDYVDEQKGTYQYRITALFTNGMSKLTDWQNAKAGELILPVG